MSVGKVRMKGNKIFVEKKRLLYKENIMTACEVFFFLTNEGEEINIR